MKKLSLLIVLIIVQISLLARPKSNQIDSVLNSSSDYVSVVSGLKHLSESALLNYINLSDDDLSKCKIYNALCWVNFKSNPPKAMKYAQLQYPLAKKIDNKIVFIYTYDNLAWLYRGFSENKKAISFMLKSLKVKEELKDTAAISIGLSGLGSIYYGMNNYKLALNYFKQTLKIEKKVKRRIIAASTLQNMGLCYVGLNDINKGLASYLKAIEAYELAGSPDRSKSTLMNIGLIYLNYKKNYDEALFYLKKAALLHQKFKDVSALSGVYGAMAEAYAWQDNFKKALIFGEKAIVNANISNDKSHIMEAHKRLALVLYKNKSYDLAYKNIQVAFNLKDSIFNTTSSEQIAEMQTKYDTEKKEAENNLLIAEKELDKAELDKKAIQQKILIVGLFMALIMAAAIAYNLSQKKKTNMLLYSKNEEIGQQHAIIEAKNKNITDSINYAQRIQHAILPEQSQLKKHFESFIYFKPKDIVSGDFYWIKEVEDKVLFSVVDCTGHGVPGAFMSIIGANSLNKIVDDLKFYKTGEILDQLNELVVIALGANRLPNNAIDNIRDGMDICICSIDKKTNVLEYSGANNSLYLLRDKENVIADREHILENQETLFYEIKSDRMAIGGQENKQKYKTHSVKLKKNDTLYLFSDGYVDQFGGPKGKKFMFKAFKRMFLSINGENMETQMVHLDKTMREWKMGMEQIDDICIMGVRI